MIARFQVATFLAFVAAVLVGVLMEYRFGVFRRLQILFHTAVNSEAKARITAAYSTDMPFENVKDEFKSVMREVYGDIEAETDGSVTLELRVQDQFTVTMTHDDGTLDIETSKIVSTMRRLRPDLYDLLDALAMLEERSAAQTEKAGGGFAPERFTATLEVPHRSKYITYHLPFGTRLTHEEFAFEHAVYDWDVSTADGTVEIEARDRDDLERIVSRMVGPFITL